MEKIFVSKILASEVEKHTDERIKGGANPDIRFYKLVDSTKHFSSGMSVGCLCIPVGGLLPCHTHLPREIYFVKSGSGILLKEDGEFESLSESDVVYIPEGAKHGLKNTGNKVLEIIWIFPTDSWHDVNYTYIMDK